VQAASSKTKVAVWQSLQTQYWTDNLIQASQKTRTYANSCKLTPRFFLPCLLPLLDLPIYKTPYGSQIKYSHEVKRFEGNSKNTVPNKTKGDSKW
jgi:hypothetical protein